mmetsp:Transcript_39327/g.82338  ORF Transcript_39327/g.82338 Transcript_39327/m.82338 type:complete len:503 (+) Transcript_39327:156-1664(+)
MPGKLEDSDWPDSGSEGPRVGLLDEGDGAAVVAHAPHREGQVRRHRRPAPRAPAQPQQSAAAARGGRAGGGGDLGVGDLEVLAHHGAADGVVEAEVVQERLHRLGARARYGGLVDLAEERPRELHPALRRSHGEGLVHRPRRARPEGEEEPAEADLGVARGRQPVRPLHLLHRAHREPLDVDEGVEEGLLLQRGPRAPRPLALADGRREAPLWNTPRAHRAPGRGEVLRHARERRVQRRPGRQAGPVEPRVPVHPLELVGAEARDGEVAKLGGVDRLELELGNVLLDELLEGVVADELLQRVEQREALFVGHGGEGVVRVDPLQLRHQRRQLRLLELVVVRHGLLQRLPAPRRKEVEVPRRVGVGDGLGGPGGEGLGGAAAGEGAALEPHGPALVEPEVLPRLVGHQVPGPRVADLVRHHPRQRPVPGKQGGGDEGQARVLHAAVGEGGGQAEDVVAGPEVRAREALPHAQKLLGLGELVGDGLQQRGLRPHLAPRTDVARG